MSGIKKKRISKKNKAAWRKTDINDVEEYLEEQRQEERVGSYTEKKDEDLFTIDADPKVPVKRAGVTPKQRRKLNAQKPMRSWDALENRSKVQDPIAKRNHVKQKKNGRNIEEEVRNPTRPRHFKANSDRELYYKELEERQAKPKNDPKNTARDIWMEEDFRDKLPGLKDEKGWVSKDLARHVVDNVGPKVVKVHDSIRHRTTKAKKFIPPHPGISYNPSLKDHRNLIDAVVEREEKIIKVEKHLKRVTTQMFSKVTPEERDRRQIAEMSMGLEEDDINVEKKSFLNNSSEDSKMQEFKNAIKGKATKRKIKQEETKENKKQQKTEKVVVEAEEEEEIKEAYKTINPPVENKKKSKQTRNKALRQKELQKKHAEKKALKKQIADINRIKSLKVEVAEEEEVLNELKKRRKKAEFKRKFEPKRLSRTKFQEPDADLTMPEDVAGNLRNVKVESSLLVDRFKNFQKRNILPASVKAPRQKPKKIKRFLRSSHKDPGVSHDMLRAKKKQEQQVLKAKLQS